jgi:hypothetical protein
VQQLDWLDGKPARTRDQRAAAVSAGNHFVGNETAHRVRVDEPIAGFRLVPGIFMNAMFCF